MGLEAIGVSGELGYRLAVRLAAKHGLDGLDGRFALPVTSGLVGNILTMVFL